MKDNYNIQVMELSFLRGKKPNNVHEVHKKCYI